MNHNKVSLKAVAYLLKLSSFKFNVVSTSFYGSVISEKKILRSFLEDNVIWYLL